MMSMALSVNSLRRSNTSARALLAREWPYLLVLTLALFGVAYASFSQTPMTIYWIVLAPLFSALFASSQAGEPPKAESNACAWCGRRRCIGARYS